METRKFIGSSMQDTMDLVRKEYGQDAIIHEAQELREENKFQITASPEGGKKFKRPIFPVLQKKSSMTIVRSEIPQKDKETQVSPLIKDVQDELDKFRRELKSLPSLQVSTQIQEMKMLLSDMRKDKYQEGSYPLHLQDIYLKLKTSGIGEGIISEVMNTLENATDQYLPKAIQCLLPKMSVYSEDFRSPVCLVGPTGVGKTLTTVKIAAAIGTKVQLISVDNLKLGASDQLRIYSRILDADFECVSDIEDIPQIIASNPVFTIIDTPGVTLKGEVQKNILTQIKALPIPVSFHGVLSATMKQRDMEETLRGISFLNPESLIFTKLDESWNFGEIFNTSYLHSLPLSYFATGQSLDDFEKATKERVIERIFQL